MLNLNIKKKSINNLKLKYKKQKNPLQIGNIIYLQYLLIKNDEIKINNFIGIILSISKKKSLLIKNNIKKENINLTINLNSPLIIKIKKIKKYKKKYRLHKLYYKNQSI